MCGRFLAVLPFLIFLSSLQIRLSESWRHSGIAATGIMVFFLLGTFLDEAQVSYLKSAEAPAKQPLM